MSEVPSHKGQSLEGGVIEKRLRNIALDLWAVLM